MNGLNLEKNYPYKAINENCQNITERVEFSVKATWIIENQSEEVLKEALYLHGPITVLFDCQHDLFIKYSSGIYFDSECLSSSSGLTHAALITG